MTTENYLFDWEKWDMAGDYADMQFYNCTLKENIGLHKAGSFIPCITILHTSGKMSFYDNDGNETDFFQIRLSLV